MFSQFKHSNSHVSLFTFLTGFTIDGTVKLIDFGLATVVDGGSTNRNDVYEMSGETGSLRYMAPEVAACRPYNHKADVYSFGKIRKLKSNNYFYFFLIKSLLDFTFL